MVDVECFDQLELTGAIRHSYNVLSHLSRVNNRHERIPVGFQIFEVLLLDLVKFLQSDNVAARLFDFLDNARTAVVRIEDLLRSVLIKLKVPLEGTEYIISHHLKYVACID